MNPEDPMFPLYNVGGMLQSSKRLSYRQRLVAGHNTYFRFLQDNGLTTRVILEAGQLPGPETVVRRGDLTEEGFEFIRRAEKKWWGMFDRRAATDPSAVNDTRILERELKKLRAERGGSEGENRTGTDR